MNPQKCDKCGKAFTETSIFWKVRIELTAEMCVQLGNNNLSAQTPDLDQILDRVYLMDQESLENQVYQKFQYNICRDCRDHFAANPMNASL